MSRLPARAYARLPTEQPNPRTRHIDTKSARDIVRLINAEDRLVPLAVAKAAPAIARGVEAVAAAIAGGGSVLFLGAGTSGRLAVLEAAECPPTFNTKPGQVRAVMAGGKSSVFRAKEGAEDDPVAGRRAGATAGPKDCVVGVAASGVTPFVRAALDEARRRGARTILVTSHGRPEGRPADIVIAMAVGPEVVTGSTRLKSGTAAKLALNSLTTAVLTDPSAARKRERARAGATRPRSAMIRAGKVYDHWMVDLKPTSRKLKLRGERIIADLGRVAPARARSLFRAAEGSVKTAVVMARFGLDAAGARAALARAGGRLRAVLEGKR